MSHMQWAGFGLWLVHAAVDFWLGRTNKVKSNSLLELILVGIAIVFTLVYIRRPK